LYASFSAADYNSHVQPGARKQQAPAATTAAKVENLAHGRNSCVLESSGKRVRKYAVAGGTSHVAGKLIIGY
jgi:hypothetical protein